MSKDNVFEYKGYLGSIETSLSDLVLHGKIQFIRDVITYAADSLADLKTEFQISVDEYLADCEELGKTPDKPFSGSFNIRIGAERHERLAKNASKKGVKLNELICQYVDQGLADSADKQIHFHLYGKKEIPFERNGSAPKLPDSPSIARDKNVIQVQFKKAN
jgi:predicted HicB family RNase H-like nuclease